MFRGRVRGWGKHSTVAAGVGGVWSGRGCPPTIGARSRSWVVLPVRFAGLTKPSPMLIYISRQTTASLLVWGAAYRRMVAEGKLFAVGNMVGFHFAGPNLKQVVVSADTGPFQCVIVLVAGMLGTMSKSKS